jgi:flagellar biosynthesis protein FlhG
LASYDQAEGLRRMLEGPKPRVVTFLSAMRDEEKSAMLINLGASLARQGNQVMLVDARAMHHSVGAWLDAQMQYSLLDVARQRRTMEEAVKLVSVGLSAAMLAKGGTATANLPRECARMLSRTFDIVVQRSDLVMVDGDLDMDDALPLASLDDGEIVIQVSTDANTIKKAYGLIKRVNSRLGKRSYGILVTGAGEKQARLVYSNMAQAASRYLAVPLHFVGFVPEDEYLHRAASLGRAVIDAFPLAGASLAFNRLAEQLASTTRSNLNMNGLPMMGVRLGM